MILSNLKSKNPFVFFSNPTMFAEGPQKLYIEHGLDMRYEFEGTGVRRKAQPDTARKLFPFHETFTDLYREMKYLVLRFGVKDFGSRPSVILIKVITPCRSWGREWGAQLALWGFGGGGLNC
jgi:hypothetical protein